MDFIILITTLFISVDTLFYGIYEIKEQKNIFGRHFHLSNFFIFIYLY